MAVTYEDFLWNAYTAEAKELGKLISHQIMRMREVNLPCLKIEGTVNQPCILDGTTHVLRLEFHTHEREVAYTHVQCDTIPELVTPLMIARYENITNGYISLIISKHLLYSCLKLTSTVDIPNMVNNDLYSLGEYV